MGFLDRVLSKKSFDTRFGRADIIVMPDEQGRRVRILRLEGTYQSGSYEGDGWAELAFAYYRGFDAVFEAPVPEGRPWRALMLGGGGFAWPKHVLTERTDVQLDVVEADPQIVGIARESFYLDKLEALLARQGREGDLRIIVDDAAVFLSQTDARYDAIINDVFQAACTPEQTATDAFFDHVARTLHPQGVYAQNVIVNLARESPYQLFALMTMLGERFAHVCTIDATDDRFGSADNCIVLATNADISFKNAIPFSV